METTTQGINITYSVKNALDKTDEQATSWQLVQQLLKIHGEYALQRGKLIAGGKGPTRLKPRNKASWIDEVLKIFDTEMVKDLHGRLLILGLCQLEKRLKDYLDKIGFLVPLSDELKEDFESLLLPKYAGDHAYKRTFLKRLNNKPVGGTKQRGSGFVALIQGGPGLKDFAKLCHRQRWNRCYTARYVLNSSQPIYEAVQELANDLKNLSSGTASGDFLPELVSNQDIWNSDVKPWIKTEEEKFGAIGMNDRTGAEFMEVGKRLVLLIEYRRVSKEADPSSIALNELVNLIHNIPERVCLVISGLSPELAAVLEKYQSNEDPGAPVLPLSLPDDPELKSSQPLANDIPAGPDLLNLMGEVNAIAEAVVLKDLNPPLVVGILGGWGSGKSFVLHLLKNRIQEIRCEPVSSSNDDDFPFVGHPYIINFDAWTYAKSNLWASLMQKIFMELDRQIGTEQMLKTELDIAPRNGGEVWKLLNELSDNAVERIKKSKIGQEALKNVIKLNSGELEGKRLWDELEKLKKTEIDRLRIAEVDVELIRFQRDNQELLLKQSIDRDITMNAQQSALQKIGENLLETTWKKLTKNGQSEEQPPSFAQLLKAINWFSKLNKVPVSYLVGFLFFILGSVALSYLDISEVEIFGISGVGGILGIITTGFFKFQQWAGKMQQQFDDAVKENRKEPEQVYQNTIRSTIEKYGTSEKQEEPVRMDAGPEFKSIDEQAKNMMLWEQKLKEKENEVVSIRQRVGMAARHQNLLEFVQHRLEGRTYEDKLGLMHQVKDDLEELSDALMHDDGSMELFERGKPRIILLIDDLDRCPPLKVVEVLEAAQLLVKTSLFVVVIAMDVRYVTRALEHEYEGVLTPFGEPTGLDYIEKIIQIPYRVRPVSESAVKSFLWAQMKPHTDVAEEDDNNLKDTQDPGKPATPSKKPTAKQKLEEGEEGRRPDVVLNKTELRVLPKKALYFSKDEHQIITQCCSVFDVSPRTMKRLVNVFKLLKIIWYRDKLGEGPEEDIKRTMLALLVIAARYPEPMRELLHLMERKYLEAEAIADDNVVKFLTGACKKRIKDSLVPQMWKEVQEALSNDILVAQNLTFAELNEHHLHLVSSFSFVGESDPLRQVELEKNGGISHNGISTVRSSTSSTVQQKSRSPSDI